MNAKRNRLLNHYFMKYVPLKREDISHVYSYVTSLIDKLLELCHQFDRDIGDKAIYGGSYWQGLKVDLPDEYDVCVPFNSNAISISKTQNYENKPFYSVRLRNKYNNDILWNDKVLKEASENYEVIDTFTGNLLNKMTHISVPATNDIVVSGEAINVLPFLVRQRLKTAIVDALNCLSRYQGHQIGKNYGTSNISNIIYILLFYCY